jgi:hypothetical protein
MSGRTRTTRVIDIDAATVEKFAQATTLMLCWQGYTIASSCGLEPLEDTE